MFVPRAVKRSGPVPANRNKKSRTISSTTSISTTSTTSTSTSTGSKVETVEKLDFEKQTTNVENFTNLDKSTNNNNNNNIDLKIEHIGSQNEKDKDLISSKSINLEKKNEKSVKLINENIQQQIISKDDNEYMKDDDSKKQNIINQLVSNDDKMNEKELQHSQKIQENDELIKEPPIKEFSYQQRIPLNGEPICIICGKYGEYICDETDNDICSLECKKIDIERLKIIQVPIKEFSNQQRSAFDGEPICIICGKYGEYICDETDNDVCSLECKKIDTERAKIIQQSSSSLKETQSKITVQTPISGLFHAQLTGYTPDSVINSLSEFQIQSILKRNQINVFGKNIPRPILSFTQCKLPEKMMENLQTEKYIQPTSIQMQIIPTILIGRDILANGQTGSGKTASFLIPIISHCYTLSQCYEGKNGPYAIILTPTRELCYQIEILTKSLSKGLLNMKTALLVGGLPMPNQVHRLKQGIQIAIATPGRLIDILNQNDKELSMSSIHMFVLDEVDMMFKMGFEKQVKEIINKLPLPATSLQRQTLMFSATIPENIENLSKSLLKDHIRITVGLQQNKNKNKNLESSLSNFIPNIPVKQTILWVENQSKKKQLFSLLNDPKYYKPPIVIFVESRIGADLLSKAIEKKCNARCVSIHGDKSQEERLMILQSFLNGEYEIIVSTGVLSRGLNLSDVKMVINFDMAVSIDEYVHQVGRASGNESSGRFPSGWGITFINEDHKHLFKKFVTMLKAQPVGRVTPLPSKLLNHL